jgi:hypothetical protein
LLSIACLTDRACGCKGFLNDSNKNITKDEPGLKDELRVLIKEQMDIESAAFRSRGNKILKM